MFLYLESQSNIYKGEDTPRHISVEIHLSTVFYRCIVYFQAFDIFSRHLKKVFHVQIFLPTRLVKITFRPKDFQRHQQACSNSSPSSIVEMRLRARQLIFCT